MHFKKSGHSRTFLKSLSLCIGLTLLTGGATVFANGILDATTITGSNKYNMVTVSDDSVTVSHWDRIWFPQKTIAKGRTEWDTIRGGQSNGSNEETNQPMGNRVNIIGNGSLTIHHIIGGQVTNLDGNHDWRVVNNNIVSISGNGTLYTDEIIGGYRDADHNTNDSVHGNVIDIVDRHITNATKDGRVSIYGAKIGDDDSSAVIHGNAESSIINISGTAKLENADIYGGYTNVSAWGGHVLNNQINLSGDADLSTSSLYGAETSNLYHQERNNVLNIGYKNNISTEMWGTFPVKDGEDGKGTYLQLDPEVSTWNKNKVQNVGEFTAIKVWSMKDYDTPALDITGDGNFKYSYGASDNYSTVIDLSYLTSGDNYGTNYGQPDQNSHEVTDGDIQNMWRTRTIDLTKDGTDTSNIFFAKVKPNKDITVIKVANSNFTSDNKILANTLIYGYNLSNGNDNFIGTYTGQAALEKGNVVWKTGDITAASVSLPNRILDASGTASVPFKLEKYGYVFDGNTKLSMDNMHVTNNTSTLISPSDSWTLVDGSDATSVTGLGNLAGKENEVSYDMSGGAVTVAGKGSTGISSDSKSLTYHLDNPTSLTYHTLDWASTDPVASLDSSKAYDLSGTKVDWSNLSMKNLSSLKGGLNERTLLDSNGISTGLTDNSLVGTEQHLTAGTTLEGTGRALLKDGNVVYDADMHAQAQTHNVLMGNEAGIAALLESNDLVLDTMKNLDKSKDGGEAFATIGGGENRYETGSHITTNIWRSQTGFAVKNTEKDGAQAEYGLFYDYGDGSYRTFYNGRGNGKIDYKGAGIFGKRIEANGTYEEASLRFGRASNDAKNILHDAEGRGYHYKTDSMYNAIHLGFGKILDRGHGNSLDTYFRFFHTHLNGDSFDAGGHYDIDSLDSNVARIGTRWQHQDHRFEYYAGLAYEYEFSGKAYGTADGADIEGASIRGGSVRFEYGTSVDTGKWRVAINGSDYAGKRRGFNGNISLTCHIW